MSDTNSHSTTTHNTNGGKSWKDRVIDWLVGGLGTMCLILVTNMHATVAALEQRVNHLEGSERVFTQQLNEIQRSLEEIKGDLKRQGTKP